ncbi:hypothetical protein ACWGH2_41925 [Streptomyces sp. NPDC054871]
MNLPGDTIDVGTTRTPTLAPYASGGITSARLDPAFLADRERLRPLVKEWSREELYAVANLLFNEGDGRIEPELTTALRALMAYAPNDSDARVVSVQFGTDAGYEEGVYWSDESLWLHRADGSVIEFEFPEEPEATEEFTALDGRFRDLLADYSRTDHPADGARLAVELESGTFTVTNPVFLA